MKVLDTVWMVALPRNKGVIYAIELSAQKVWKKIEDEEIMGTGVTAAYLRSQGYTAKRVQIILKE